MASWRFGPEMSDYWDWCLRIVLAGYPLIQLPGQGAAVAIHGANTSYSSQALERQKNLDNLCAKHINAGYQTLKQLHSPKQKQSLS